MGNFFKSKSFFVLITVLLLLAGIPTILSAMGQGSLVRDGVMAVVTPAMRGARAIGDAFAGFGKYFSEFDRLKEENEALAARVRELEKELADRLALSQEQVVLQLKKQYDECQAEKDHKNALKALELMGKHLGMFEKTKPGEGSTDPKVEDVL